MFGPETSTVIKSLKNMKLCQGSLFIKFYNIKLYDFQFDSYN
jgi:hypothetical protein